MGLWLRRLFLNVLGHTFGVKGNYAVALGILYIVGKYGGTGFPLSSMLQFYGESAAVEDVVSQNQGDLVATNKVLTQYKSLGQAIWAGLHCVTDVNAPA